MTTTTTPTSGAADLLEALIYAELPKHAATGLGEEYESFDQNGKPMGKAYQNLVYYTEDQMRAFADATHALRVESLAAAYCEELDKLSQRNYEMRLASNGQAPAGATKPTEQQILEATEKAGLWPNTVRSWIPAFHRYHKELAKAQSARDPADSVLEDAERESEYQRGYRHGYEQRDAEVRGAMA